MEIPRLFQQNINQLAIQFNLSNFVVSFIYSAISNNYFLIIALFLKSFSL